jgi:acetylglutamate kinase
MDEYIGKAKVLLEAMPYIRNFRGKYFVIKFGGSVLADRDLRGSIITDIVFLSFVGIKPVIVHGGGPGINSALEKAGMKPEFINGLRATCDKTMSIVEKVLYDVENSQISGLIEHAGGKSLRLDGRKSGIIGKKLGGDLGRVGEISGIDKNFLFKIKSCGGAIPVICPIGCSEQGEVLNINADDVSAEVAASLPAEKIVLVTDVEGIKGAGGVYSTLKTGQVEELISSGIIEGGMIPKVKACVRALERGVSKAHMVNGNTPHALLLEIFTDKGIGTEIIL